MSDDATTRSSGHQPLVLARRKTPALGRGLGALLGDTRREQPVAATEETPATGFALLPVDRIEPHPEQPRRRFDEQALDELAASIAQRGVIQPIVVRSLNNGRYQLVAGERRWRAAQRARLHEVPVLIRELSDRDVMALALIENLQREDLNPIEEARAYHRLVEDEGLSQAEIARMVDKSRSHVSNLQRLLSLPDPVIAMVETGSLSMGHARALIGADDAETIADMAVARRMSVREVEAMVRRKGESVPPARQPRAPRAAEAPVPDADLIAVQTQLEELLGLQVRIVTEDEATGAVTIRYHTLDQLDLLCQRLSGGAI